MKQGYANWEGIDLLSGIPSYGSLQLWLRHSNTTPSQKIQRNYGKSSFELDEDTDSESIPRNSHDGSNLGYVFKDQGFDVNANEAFLELFEKENSMRKIILKQRARQVGCTSRGDIFVVLNDGGLGVFKAITADPGVARPESSNSLLFPSTLPIDEKKQENEDFDFVIHLNSFSQIRGRRGEVWFWDDPLSDRFRRWLPIETVCCGEDHICCVTDAGSGRKLFTWGSNLQGQCGLSSKEIITSPTLVEGISGEVLCISCGPNYTVCISLLDNISHALFSFGHVNAKQTLFRSSRFFQDESTVPHFDVNNYLIPLIEITPQVTAHADPTERPFKFWTSGLSKFLVDTYKKFVSSTYSLPPFHRLDVSVEDDDDLQDSSIELQNSRSRSNRMQSSLEFDLSTCALFPTKILSDDPAPFEIHKTLITVENELVANKASLDLFDDPKFDEDRRFFQSERDKMLVSKSIYEHVAKMWGDQQDDLTDEYIEKEKLKSNHEILISLLEDCRHIDFIYLVKQTKEDNLLKLLNIARTNLDLIRMGLDEMRSVLSSQPLYDPVYKLYLKKVKIQLHLTEMVNSVIEEVSSNTLDARSTALNVTGTSKYDLDEFEIR